MSSPHGPVANGDLRRHLEPAGLDVDQQLAPALLAFAHADLEADKLVRQENAAPRRFLLCLTALGRGPENDQHTLGPARSIRA